MSDVVENEWIEKIQSGKINCITLIPKDELTYAICLACVKKRVSSFMYVPHEYRTKEVFIEVAKKNPMLIADLSWFRNPDIAFAAVSSNGMALTYIPEYYRSSEIIETALKMNGCAIRYVNNPSIKYCKMALEQTRNAFDYVPLSFWTDEIIQFVLSLNDARVIKVIPPEYLKPQII